MPAADWMAMLLLGFFGTGHCLGMCGPLVVAFPGRSRQPFAHFVYHLGRVLVYVCIGGMLGGAGLLLATLAAADPGQRVQVLGRIQVLFSLLAGGGLLYMAVLQLGLIPPPSWVMVDGAAGASRLGRLMAAVHRWPPLLAMTGLGAVNGLLPCGLSYAAFLRAAGAEGVGAGMLLCLAFGIGTCPGLLLLGTGAAAVVRRYRRQADIVSGMVMGVMATMLIVKALGGLLG